MKILVVGNNKNGLPSFDGQTVKTRLYIDILKKENIDYELVDLFFIKKRPLSTLSKIRKGIKSCDTILFLGGPAGSRFLIPYIVKHNKDNKNFVYSLIGQGTLCKLIRNLSTEDKTNFLINHEYKGIKDDKVGKALKEVTCILPETDKITELYQDFYGLSNCVTMTNFRDMVQPSPIINEEDDLKLVFVSRINKLKGILDAMDVINEINGSSTKKIKLDIYGPFFFDEEDKKSFDNKLNELVKYKGVLNQSEIVDTVSKYDSLIFPTKYMQEGTPGVIAESLISGVPIITSKFAQADVLMKDGFDSFFYEFNDYSQLKEILNKLLNDKSILKEYKKNALMSGQKYLYSYNRDLFLKILFGTSRNK